VQIFAELDGWLIRTQEPFSRNLRKFKKLPDKFQTSSLGKES